MSSLLIENYMFKNIMVAQVSLLFLKMLNFNKKSLKKLYRVNKVVQSFSITAKLIYTMEN